MLITEVAQTLQFTDDRLFLLDQRALPNDCQILEITNIDEAYNAIKTLTVRGAPAIGVAGAYSIVVSIKLEQSVDIYHFRRKSLEFIAYLKSSRPTAFNLSYALDILKSDIENYKGDSSSELYNILKSSAINIHNEDIKICRSIGEYGVTLINDNDRILTHCNAGALATSDIGTALAPIYIAKSRGMHITVYSDETRPLLQGARLTCYELMKNNIDVILLCDNMAGSVMSKGLVDKVIIGCDRVAKNGDTANKIGSLSVAILADYYKIPLYVALPSSTFDINCKSGDDIIIEERDSDEVTLINGTCIAPIGVGVYNPSFDIIPNKLINAFITDKGIIKKPFDTFLAKELYG